MDVFEAIWTTRAMRHLDPDQTVSDDDIWKIVEAASKGPGRDLSIRWVVVSDADKRREVGEIYRSGWLPQSQRMRAAGFIPKSGDYLGEHLGDSPVIVLATSSSESNAASVFPQIQNLLIAARALGLGTTLTTSRGPEYESQLRAALKMPDGVKIWAVIPVGYPTGRWGEAKRQPIEDLTYWNEFNQTRRR